MGHDRALDGNTPEVSLGIVTAASSRMPVLNRETGTRSMTLTIDCLHHLEKKDIPRASRVLADAFHPDPVWETVFQDLSDTWEKELACFEVPVRYCMTYGYAVAPTAQIEGVAGLVPSGRDGMNMWQVVRSGAFGAALRMGSTAGQRLSTLFAPLLKGRRRHMRGRHYLYLLIVGVSPEHQHQGFGRQLIGAVIDESVRRNVPLYLETETETNVRMYQHLGFEVLEEITLPAVGLPMWQMVREPVDQAG